MTSLIERIEQEGNVMTNVSVFVPPTDDELRELETWLHHEACEFSAGGTTFNRLILAAKIIQQYRNRHRAPD